MTARGTARLGLLAALFVIGFALMGFEMLGSRYLNPYFGGGITTWACLISVVLFAMMVGYFAGGYAVDAYPGVELLALCVVLAAVCMLIVPPTADPVLQFIIQTLGDGFLGVLIASLALSLVPVAFLSACSPFVVRLLLVDLQAGGKTAGLVYSVSTLGNVAGTLATTFYFIPSFGTRAITTAFGIVLAVVAVLLYLGKQQIAKGVRTAAVVGLALAVVGWPLPTRANAEEPARDAWSASYPEGPLWVGERLLYAEMGADKVVEWRAGQRRDLWAEPGCGPTAISLFRDAQFIVLCHLSGRLVHLDAAGRKIGAYVAASDGELLRNPNDGHTDGRGGVFFSDAGLFAQGAPATGKVFHLAADGTLRKIADGFAYANGIAVDFAKKRLLVSEHLARKVWQYDLRDDLSITSRRLFLDVAKYLSEAEVDYAETGPDGIEVDRDGTVFVPVYGAGRIVAVAPDGSVSKLTVPMKFVTNIAISGTRAAVVGPFINDQPPFPGRVEVMPRQALLDLAKRAVSPVVR
jgi:sugar lactone lactonase YvrE